jgi:hypothetical protein
MVKITNIGNKYRILRTRKGNVLRWNKGDTVEVEDKNLLRQFKSSKYFKVEDGLHAKDIGGGLKTHVKPAKPKRKATRAKKEKVEPKKPKGLKKSKRAD